MCGSLAVRSPASGTRDSVSFSEPSLFPLTTKAVAPPLRAFLRNPPPNDSKHVLGSVAVLEAGEDHPLLPCRLRRTSFGRHTRSIARCERAATLHAGKE